MGYGVIGNTAVSGTAILGSSPSTPAKIGLAPGPRPVGLAVMTPPSQGGDRRFESGTGYDQSVHASARQHCSHGPSWTVAPLCSGLARRPLKAVARVRIPSGLPAPPQTPWPSAGGSGAFTRPAAASARLVVDLRSARASTGRLGATAVGFSGCGLRPGWTQDSSSAPLQRWICHRIALRGGSATFPALYRWRIHRRRGQTWQRFSLLVDRATRREKRCPPHPQVHPRFFLRAPEVERICVDDGIPWQTQNP